MLQIIGIDKPKSKHSGLKVRLTEFSLYVGDYDIFFSKNIEVRWRALIC